MPTDDPSTTYAAAHLVKQLSELVARAQLHQPAHVARYERELAKAKRE